MIDVVPLPLGQPLVVHGGCLLITEGRVIGWHPNSQVADHAAQLLDEHGLIAVPDTPEGVAP